MYQPPRPKSPYAPPQNLPAQITPGSLTYTTTIGPDGRVVYNTFRAEPASYQTPTGIVHGIQWVPADATHILPPGAQPASPEFTASWNKSPGLYERQREDEKKRKKKEKEEAKARERRRSFVGTGPMSFPVSAPTADPYAGSNSPYGALDRQFGDLDISGRARGDSRGQERVRTVSGNYGAPPGPYSKPYPAAGPHMSAYANPSPNMRAADVLPNASTGYPASPYSSAGKPIAPIARAASPQPYPPTTSPYGYPQPPRSRATTPIPGSVPAPTYAPQPRSRAPSPMPAYPPPRSRPVSPMPVPEVHSNQPNMPESFSRPVNGTLTFPPFDAIKIQDMDDFLERLPKLPMILQPHDVNHHDWIRLSQDLSVAWAGKMPVPPERAANPPKRHNLIAELLHTWNTTFFLPRAVEVVLYKGTVRYSGPKAGLADLPHNGDDDDDDESTSSSEESSDDEPFYGAPPQSVGMYGNAYGAPHTHYAGEVHDARRKRREEKAERRRRRKERRQKRRQRAKEKKYTLFVTYVPVPRPGPMPGGYPAPRPGGY